MMLKAKQNKLNSTGSKLPTRKHDNMTTRAVPMMMAQKPETKE